MGYYTRHTLCVDGLDAHSTDHEQAISDISGYSNCFDDEIKWYEHERHMRNYSEQYPYTLFKLAGAGEETGDFWVEYYMNGKMQRCKGVITYPDFDHSKLK